MGLRRSLLVLVVVQWWRGGLADESAGWCERVCTGSRPEAPPPCPPAPACPTPICPAPICPAPLVNLTCPEPRCPPPAPPPSTCPPSVACPVCAPPAEPPTAGRPLPIGYVRYADLGTYKLYPDEVVWMGANSTCFADGGYLAIPKSMAELNVMIYIMENSRSRKAFIGFHDFSSEGNFRTVLGKPMNSFQHSLWGSGEPDGGVKRNGVYLKTDGRIYDYYNTGTFPFICELPMSAEK